MWPAVTYRTTPPSPILVVDDDAELGQVIQSILEHHGFQVIQAYNINDAIKSIRQRMPSLIIVDMRLPDGRGNDLIAYIRQREEGEAVPILVVSALVDNQSIQSARSAGADEYLTKPFQPSELLAIVRNNLQRRRAVEHLATREAHLQTVTMLANTIEARDRYTRGHVERVKDLAVRLGHRLGWSEETLTILEFGAILHDIGKIVIPEHILNKPAPLTDDEMAIMRSHPEQGAEMLKQVEHLHPAIPYVLYHHERWDGSGYPFGLRGEEIPAEGRLLAIVDVYDAMTTDRPYRKALPKSTAMEEIRRNAGVLFDPEMAATFVELMETEEQGITPADAQAAPAPQAPPPPKRSKPYPRQIPPDGNAT